MLLRSMGKQLISVEQSSDPIGSLLSELKPARWMPARSRDVELALRQLAVMLRSGLQLLSALDALRSQTSCDALRRVIDDVHSCVASGTSLADALEKHTVFPQLVVQLTHVGERTGSLDEVLEQAASYLEKRRMAISEVRVALAYPAVVTLAALVIAGYLILFVIPELQKFLGALGRKLPKMTQSLVDLAQWLQMNGSTLALLAFATLGAIVIAWRLPVTRLWIDQMILRLPVVGKVLRLAATSSLARVMVVTTQSGMRLVEALAVAVPLQSNQYLSRMVSQSQSAILRGKPLAPTLNAPAAFDPILPSMIEVAERTGELQSTLEEVAGYCDRELKSRIKRMSQLVEPAVIVIAGGIVGYVYIAFFMALMAAGGNFK